MILKRLAVIVPLGIGSGRQALLVDASRAQHAPAAAAATGTVAKTAAADTTAQPEIDPLLKELIQAARRRLLSQTDDYRVGRITIDRYIAASSDLARVELPAAKSDVERRAIRRRHVQLAREVAAHEKAERDAGRGTLSDLAEAHQGRVQAEFDMRAGEQEDAEKTSLLRLVAGLERRVEQLEKSEADRATPRAREDPPS
jgi:predicted ATPase